jgi:hypothetical protein
MTNPILLVPARQMMGFAALNSSYDGGRGECDK